MSIEYDVKSMILNNDVNKLHAYLTLNPDTVHIKVNGRNVVDYTSLLISSGIDSYEVLDYLCQKSADIRESYSTIMGRQRISDSSMTCGLLTDLFIRNLSQYGTPSHIDDESLNDILNNIAIYHVSPESIENLCRSHLINRVSTISISQASETWTSDTTMGLFNNPLVSQSVKDVMVKKVLSAEPIDSVMQVVNSVDMSGFFDGSTLWDMAIGFGRLDVISELMKKHVPVHLTNAMRTAKDLESMNNAGILSISEYMSDDGQLDGLLKFVTDGRVKRIIGAVMADRELVYNGDNECCQT